MVDEPIRLPPTVAPKSKAPRRRWVRPTVLTLLVALAVLGASLLANHEVARRFATVPLTTPTSASLAVNTVTTAVFVGTSPRRAKGSITTTTFAVTTTTEVVGETAAETTPPSEIITALDKLPVADEHPDGYRTGRFGFWRDDDHDGCNTREEVLLRSSTVPPTQPIGCAVTSGRWVSPYDGVVVTDPHDLSIDHGPTIEEAWKSGAWRWTDRQRNDYLNDLAHVDFLLAVSDAVKAAKAEYDPGYWLPPLEMYRCHYLRTWVDVKTFYKLSVDPGEREAIAAAAIGC